jgi:hypothetical protein
MDGVAHTAGAAGQDDHKQVSRLLTRLQAQ